MYFRFDTGGRPLRIISHPSICINAAFKLEHELQCTKDDLFLLSKGNWYLIIDGKQVGLQGRWIDERTNNSS